MLAVSQLSCLKLRSAAVIPSRRHVPGTYEFRCRSTLERDDFTHLLFVDLTATTRLMSCGCRYSARYPTQEELRKLWTPTVCFRWQYTDGTRATMIFGNGLVGDYPFAARLRSGEVFSTLCHLPAGAILY